MVTAMMTIVGVQQAKAYSTSELESAGWTKVTDMTSMTLSDYYFMLIDAGSSLYSVSNARPGTDSKPTYQTLQDPISDAGQVWKISNDGSAYYLQSLVDGWYFIGARDANAGWTDYMAAESTNGNFTFAVTDGKFSITSVFANGLVGPWEDADHVNLNYKLHWNALEDNFYEELACNKSAQHAPGFYIYAISRATYDNIRRSSSKLAANGWTQVTGTDQLGKSGYYYTLLDVSEAGYESGLVMAGGTGRPNYQAMNISSDNKIQIWTMASKGDGYQMKNCETDTYVFCNNGTDWDTGFTNDANNQYTEFRFTLNNGFWVISNVNSLQRSLGRWSNSPYRPGTGENIAANKADNEGKRQFLIYSIPSIAGIAIALPEGGAMTAGQWYYFDVNSEEEYSFNTTTATDIVWTADGTLLESEANTALPSGNTDLTAGRYYIKSSSDNNFVLEAPRPTTEQIAELQSLITAGDAKILGFDNGEYAPYNNVEAITLLADAKTLDLNNPNQYTQSFIAGKIAAMQNATWTANTSEVNAIYWKTDYTAADKASDNYIHPLGWTNTGYNTRIMNSETTSDAGISAVGGTAIMAKYNTTYGETQGYTMPLNANTYYKISFKYCGWGNNPTTNVVLTGPNGGVTVTPASFKPETNDGNSNANNWYEYTAIFKTGADADDYVLALNKVEGGQQQIAWGDMVLVRATAADLTYTPATGKMNADVATAQQAAIETFEANPTFEKYEALISAIDAANASVAIYQQIAARLALLAAQTGDIPQGTFEGSTTYTNYDNRVYTSLDQVIPQYKADVAAYWATNAPQEGADLTAFIVNQGFEFGDLTSWELPQGASGGAGSLAVQTTEHGPAAASEGSYFYSSWWTGKPVEQTIEGLPNGTYRLTATLSSNDTGDLHTVFLYAGNTNQAVEVPANSYGTWQPDASIDFVVTNGTITLGAVGGKEDNSFDKMNPWIFLNADNFRLTYVSAEARITPELASGLMYAGINAAQQDALDTWEDNKSMENYQALLAAIDAANASIAEYETMNKYITKQKVTANGVISWTTIDDKYNAGEYLNATDFIADYKALVVAALGNTTTTGTDMTAYAINPSFEYGDMTGWAYYRNGDSRVWENSNATYTMSNVDGDYLFNTWNNNTEQKYLVQTINDLPNGTYRVTAVFGSDADYTIEMTAESSGKEEVNNFTTGEDKSVGVEKTVDVLVEDGTLKIGAHGNNWFKVDNFRITFLTTDADMPYALVDAPMNADIEAEQTAAAAAYESNKSFDNYHRLEAAIAAAQASADKYVIINARIPKLAAQSDGIDVTALTTKYNDGDYVEADDVFDAYQEILATAFGTPAADTDMTAFIINPDFEWGDADGWAPNYSDDTGARDAHNATYEFSDSHGDYIFNTWSRNGDFLWLFQDVKHLPAGTYELSAVWATDDGYRTIEFTAENVLPGNDVDGQQVTDSFRPVDLDTRSDKDMGHVRTVTIMVTDGTLRLGGHAWGFFKADNFQLKYLGSGIVDPDLTQPMNRYEKEYYTSAKATYQADPSAENLRKVSEYRIMVENSIKAYAEAKKTLDKVKNMMDHTNVYTYDAFFTVDDLFRKYGFDGYYRYRTLEDDQAYELERMFFGTGEYRNTSNFSIPAVPFLASAWDCGYQDDKHKGYAYAQEGWVEGTDYYVNTWSREGNDDGTLMLTPYLEYWKNRDNLLDPDVLTATVEGTPNATYTVKMFVRVRINEQFTPAVENPVNHADSIALDPSSVTPRGMYIQIGNGAKFYPTWTPIRNEHSQYVLDNYRQLWVCNLWDELDPNNLPTGDVGSDGTLQIKFGIEDGSNVTWLSMKDVFVNYESEVPASEMAKLKKQIDYAKLHTTGFDPDEYAPYTNVPQLIALHRAEQVWDSPENVFLVRAVTKALKALNYTGDKAGDDDDSATVLAYDANTDLWTKNTEEMNGFYWKNDYTSADVEHIEWYDYEDDVLTPIGWNLIGRDDGFNTGIKQYGVNTNATGMKALEDATGLYAKYETDYGNEPGYTLPLKENVKYIMTFAYAYDGEGTCPETRVTLTTAKAGRDDTADSNLTITEFTPTGTDIDDMGNWHMYRATFTPTFTDDYVITFDKDNYDPEPIILGELTLVRYKEGVDNIDGQSRTAGYQYGGEDYADVKYVGTDATVSRSFTANAYNTLVLPFRLSGNELKTALGDNFSGKVYYYTGAQEVAERPGYFTLKFEERECGLLANVPVLFWNGSGSDAVENWNNKLFENMVTRRVKNDLSVKQEGRDFDFIGTYGVIDLPEGATYLTNNEFKKVSAERAGKIHLGPTRAYFMAHDADNNIDSGAKLMGFDINDVPTGVIAIEEDGSMRVTSGNIYSLDGRLVRQNATSLEGLPRGTYIVDGKKYMVK